MNTRTPEVGTVQRIQVTIGVRREPMLDERFLEI